MENDVTKDLEFVRNSVIDNIPFTEIHKSNIHGFGLFAKKDFKIGEIICILDGQIMNWDFYDKLCKKIDLKEYQNYIFMEWNALSQNTLLVRAFRTKYSYINHSKTPNVAIKYNPIRIEVIQDIKKNEEIFIDYLKEPLKQNYLQDQEKQFLL